MYRSHARGFSELSNFNEASPTNFALLERHCSSIVHFDKDAIRDNRSWIR